MKKDSKRLFDLLIRYLILIVVAFPNLWLFYLIFTPLTIYPVYYLLNIFFNSLLQGNIIIINELNIELIKACIAGSSYYLLLILNLSIPELKLNKRLKMILFSFAFLLAINILRIFSLSAISLSSSSLFDLTHKFFWYFLSIVFVIAIWFSEVRIFKIKKIPFYSDIEYLYKKSVFNK